MIPDLQSSLMCDDVRQERNGKFILIGLFDAIGAHQFPLAFPRICMVTRWCSGQGHFTQRSRILAPDQVTAVAEGQEIRFHLPHPEATATNVEIFLGKQFAEPGTHWVEILLDGDLKLRYPLQVQRAPAAPGAPPHASPPPAAPPPA